MGRYMNYYFKIWVKPFNWLIPYAPFFEFKNVRQKLSIYTFQHENSRQALWNKFGTLSLFANCFVIRKFNCKLVPTI
jgi:hypothetical protein